MKNLPLLLVIVLAWGCRERGIEAKENLSETDYNTKLAALAPYVIGKADEFNFEERFNDKNKPFYANFIKISDGKLKYYSEADTASLFFFTYRDHTSLYEHYRGLGGYFKTDEDGQIQFLNLLYHTPRLTSAEIEKRGKMLFEEMRQKGNVMRFMGNREFIQTPNDDFYYNTKINRWDYTENSSWKFLEEAKQKADSIPN
jgi:hypothetical protein